MIFVQIASYRDPELLPTIRDCLAKARYPNDLRFGICWQKGEDEEQLRSQLQDPRFRLDEVHWRDSQGLGWARSRIQRLYEGEEFTLQIDSHHRFVWGWDERLLQDCQDTYSNKPLLTTYAGVYNPEGEHPTDVSPYAMVAERFTEHGTIMFRGHHLTPEQLALRRPIRARFVSGHFFFTLGLHCQEYAYDPEIYFAGDEISLAIRSYTLGYDLFHPPQARVWHEYTRRHRVKHWDDHLPKNDVEPWHVRDTRSKRRLRQLLKEEDTGLDLGRYGLGLLRTHTDYERYAGIDFRRRLLHADAVLGVEPPATFHNDQQWEEALTTQHHTMSWKPWEYVPDLQFLYLAIEDRDGNVLYRYDAPADSPEGQGRTTEHRAVFRASTRPAKIVVWPYSRSQGWLRKAEYPR